MFLFLTLLLGGASAAPYKIGVVAEPGARARAQEFIEKISALEPFKQLIEQNGVTIVTAPAVVEDLQCRGGNSGIARLAKCNLDRTARACKGMDLCPVFTSVPNIGAGNPFNPVASSSFPWTTMLHEVVHTFGFTDDYCYTRSETPTYCRPNLDWANGHTDDKPNKFKTAELARASCLQRVPWCREAVAAGAVVVQQSADGSFTVGSPPPRTGCPSTQLGVFAGGSCQHQNPRSTWRPYFCPTVMGYPSLGEETCGVTRRHAIISRSPNLVPAYYQKVIFNAIKEKKKLRDLSFRATPEDTVPSTFTYGLPEVDRLRNPTTATRDVCQEGPVSPMEGSDIATRAASLSAVIAPVQLECPAAESTTEDNHVH